MLFFVNHEIACCHVNVKQLYRLFVSLSSIAYIIYYAQKDLLNCLIVPSGQVPLALMWGLHGETSLVDEDLPSRRSFSSASVGFADLRSVDPLLQLDEEQRSDATVAFSCPIEYFSDRHRSDSHRFAHSFASLRHVYSRALRSVRLHPVDFHLSPDLGTTPVGNGGGRRGGTGSRGYARVPSEQHQTVLLRKYLLDLLQRAARSLLRVSFSLRLDLTRCSRSSPRIITRLTRVFTYKVFILVLQSLILTSLVIVLRRSSADLSTREFCIQIALLVVLVCVELLLLLPPFIARWNVLRIQMNFIQHLLILIFVLLIVGIVLLIKNDLINQTVMIICILPLLIYAFLLAVFYLYHSVRDAWHFVRGNRQTRLVPGLVEWIESHHKISLVRQRVLHDLSHSRPDRHRWIDVGVVDVVLQQQGSRTE